MNNSITKNHKDYTAMIDRIAELSHRKFLEIYLRDNNGTRIKITTDEDWIKLHNTDQADLAKLKYCDVPSDWQKERWLGAKTALDILLAELDNGKMIDNNLIELMSAKIHDDWLTRNKEKAESEHRVSYDKLSEKAKEKDRVFALSAIEIYNGQEVK